jgi:hypothetical protein
MPLFEFEPAAVMDDEEPFPEEEEPPMGWNFPV